MADSLHNQAGLLIALAEEAKQMLGPHPIQGDVAEFVDNNQGTPSDVLLKLQDRPFLTGLDIGVDQFGGGEELQVVGLHFTCLPALLGRKDYHLAVEFIYVNIVFAKLHRP